MKSLLPENVSNIHCEFCMTPVEIWESLADYEDDKCCQFYSDVWDIAEGMEKEFGSINKDGLIKACDILKHKYRDIPNFLGAILECYDSFEDLGVFAIKSIAL